MAQTWEFMDGNSGVKTCSGISGVPTRLVSFDNGKTTGGDENYKRSHVCHFQHVVSQVLKGGVPEMRVANPKKKISKSAVRENINSE